MSETVKKIGKCATLSILSQIPVVSAFSKFCEDFVSSSRQERIDVWQKECISRFSKLNADMEEKIRKTSNFASILSTAQRGALDDVEENKVGLYVNAVINAIKSENIDNTRIHIFLNMLRDFSLLHIKILEDIAQSKAPTFDMVRMVSHHSLPRELRMKYKDKDLLEAILKGLSEHHLIYTVQDKISATEPTIITDFGKEFLQFIAAQEKKDE